MSFFNKLLGGSETTTPVSKVYFSPGEGCTAAIISALKNAQKSVDICVFTISDDRISRELIACHQRGVKVRIVTDNDKLQDEGSDIKTFKAKGIPIKTDRTSAHLHHKFALIDGKLLLNGSFNWTRSASQFNHENLVLSYESGLISAFKEEFNQLWKNCTTF